MKKLQKKIIGRAYKVFNKSCFGFPGSVYQNSLFTELKNEGIEAATEIKKYSAVNCVNPVKIQI